MAYIQKNNPFKKISSITTGNFKKSPLSVRRPEANPNDLRETAYTQNSSFKQKTSTDSSDTSSIGYATPQDPNIVLRRRSRSRY